MDIENIAAHFFEPFGSYSYSAELAAQIEVNKYCDHLPGYGQGKMFERGGIKIADSTLGEWLYTSVELLSPIM